MPVVSISVVSSAGHQRQADQAGQAQHGQQHGHQQRHGKGRHAGLHHRVVASTCLDRSAVTATRPRV
jgi:hypothetical protein